MDDAVSVLWFPGSRLFSWPASGFSRAGTLHVDDGRERPAQRSSGGSPDFTEIFRTYEADVAGVCRRMLRGVLDEAVEDASAEVFLRARRAQASYDPERPLRAWLLGIAGNHCLDLLRRRGTEARLFDPRDLTEDEPADPGPSPLRRLLRAEQRASLLSALDELDPKHRLPLVLRYFSELDYAAIADVLGVTPNQVGSLLFRAKRRLRSRLAAEAGS